MKIKLLLIPAFVSISLFTCAVAFAAVPQTISYQGYLTNASGQQLNGQVNIVFKLYKADNTEVWSETQSGVTVTKGVYSVVLGTLVSLGSLPFDEQYYLGIKVGTDAEMSPRQPLTSVGYAMRSATSDTIGTTCQVGQVLAQTASGWGCRSLAIFPNAVGTCAGSLCDLTCASGYGNCDSDTSNGCETSVLTDPLNCGQCGNVCPTPANMSATCAGGACGHVCWEGWADCNNNIADGCEVHTNSDPNNCGSCGHACSAGMVCWIGRCSYEFASMFPSPTQCSDWDNFRSAIDPAKTYDQITIYDTSSIGSICTGYSADILCKALHNQLPFTGMTTQASCPPKTWVVGYNGYGVEISTEGALLVCYAPSGTDLLPCEYPNHHWGGSGSGICQGWPTQITVRCREAL